MVLVAVGLGVDVGGVQVQCVDVGATAGSTRPPEAAATRNAHPVAVAAREDEVIRSGLHGKGLGWNRRGIGSNVY